MPENKRPDLSDSRILLLAAAVILVAITLLLWPGLPAPGSPSGQVCAAVGTLLLLAPAAFLVMKRSGLAANPPTWWVIHVLATMAGSCLILVHAAAGDWVSPPGLVLFLLTLLILQGSLLRTYVSRGFSRLFARNSLATGFNAPGNIDKSTLQAIIDAKTKLLQTLDPSADEALFSPALKHWLRHPLQSRRYLSLASREARLVGARAGAGIEPGWSRRIHMFAALVFYLGLAAHIFVVLFFAGYATGGETIDWWYITDWGR